MAQKVDKIGQIASSSDKMRLLTGFVDSAGDLTKDLFMLVGLLELYSSAYLEADCYFARAHSISSVVNPPKDRLLCYLQLVSSLKRAALEKSKRPPPSGAQTQRRTSSTGRVPAEKGTQVDINALKNADLT